MTGSIQNFNFKSFWAGATGTLAERKGKAGAGEETVKMAYSFYSYSSYLKCLWYYFCLSVRFTFSFPTQLVAFITVPKTNETIAMIDMLKIV